MFGTKKVFILPGLLLALILSSPIVFGVGLSPPSYFSKMVYGKSEEFTFLAVNTMDFPMNISITASSELDVIVDPPIIFTKPKGYEPFKVRINYPQQLFKPGVHRVEVTVTEERTSEGMMSARAAVIGVIHVREAFPGVYAEATVRAEDSTVNKTVPVEVTLHNYGTDTINSATGYVEVYFNDELVDTLELSRITEIAAFESKSMFAQLNTKGFKQGKYVLKAYVNYDGQITIAECTFRLGIMYVEIVDFTRQAVRNKINRFEIIVENMWNERIENIYADVNVFENNSVKTKFKTVSDDVEKWEKKILLGYLDAEGLAQGRHDIEISLNYQGIKTIKEGTIDIIEGVEPLIEKPVIIQNKQILYMAALMVLLVVTIIILLILILRRKKR